MCVRAYIRKLRDEKMIELNEGKDEIITHTFMHTAVNTATHTYTWLGGCLFSSALRRLF